MTNRWDDFSKLLAEESSTRRESLRLLGAALAGAVLSPLALGTARGAGKSRAADPCKTICRCSKKTQRDACLAACRSCTGATSRLCGSCGTGVNCYDLAHDVNNCGACGNACLPGPYETAACLSGRCVYSCVEGAVRCNGACTYLDWDPDNCGACGNVCPASAPVCVAGTCSERTCIPYCPEGWCGGDGCGGECACPNGWFCDNTGDYGHLNYCIPE
jgi:stigma-specific protein Stig1